MRVNKTFTVAVSTGNPIPIQVCDERTLASRVFVQMLTGGSGRGLVMDGVAINRTPATPPADFDVTAELAAATSTAPGGTYSDSDPGGSIDMQKFYVAGYNAGDKIKVSFDQKV